MQKQGVNGMAHNRLTSDKKPTAPVVVVFNGSNYSLDELVMVGKTSPGVGFDPSELHTGEGSGRIYPKHYQYDGSVIVTKHDDKMVVIVGHDKVKEGGIVTAQLVSKFALKKAKV